MGDNYTSLWRQLHVHGEFLIMPSCNVSAKHLQLLPFLIKCRNARSYHPLRPCHCHHLPTLESGRRPFRYCGIHSPQTTTASPQSFSEESAESAGF